MRILIIEDEFKIADVIASRLRNEQYVVDVFGDVEEGLDNVNGCQWGRSFLTTLFNFL